MLQVLERIIKNDKDTTRVSLVFANIEERDILLKEQLDALAVAHPLKFRVHYVLERYSLSSDPPSITGTFIHIIKYWFPSWHPLKSSNIWFLWYSFIHSWIIYLSCHSSDHQLLGLKVLGLLVKASWKNSCLCLPKERSLFVDQRQCILHVTKLFFFSKSLLSFVILLLSNYSIYIHTYICILWINWHA